MKRSRASGAQLRGPTTTQRYLRWAEQMLTRVREGKRHRQLLRKETAERGSEGQAPQMPAFKGVCCQLRGTGGRASDTTATLTSGEEQVGLIDLETWGVQEESIRSNSDPWFRSKSA
jgi:hypothetical protein